MSALSGCRWGLVGYFMGHAASVTASGVTSKAVASKMCGRGAMQNSRAVAIWGAAWAGGLYGAVLLAVAGLSSAALAVGVAAIVGVVLVGLPVGASAWAAGSSRPSREAIAVGVACAAAVLVYGYVFSPDTGLNINTAATIAERNARFAGPHLPEELVWGFWLSILGPLVGGMVSSWLAMGSQRMSWESAADFGSIRSDS